MRKQFNFYRSFWDIARDLPPKDRLEFFEIICRAEFLEIDIGDINPRSTLLKVALSGIKHNIKSQIDGYRTKTGENEPCQPPSVGASVGACQPPSVQLERVIDNSNIEIINNNTVKRFAPPCVDDVKSYVVEKNYHFDAESFVAFYASKGWKVGNVLMKDWKSACVTWEKRYIEKNGVPSDKPRGRSLV